MSTGFKITKDYINNNGYYSRVGVKTAGWRDEDEELLEFRCLDDDGKIYYEGLLKDNEFCDGQSHVLDFSIYDAGCTIVQVKRNGQWKQEID